jgi:hypothetical protein
MHDDFLLFFSITLGLLLGARLLHLLPRMGQAGKRLSEAACHAPLLDVIVCYFTVLPLIIGPLVAGWAGLLTAVIAQLATLLIWQTIHEAVHRDAAKGPRIIKALNKKVGPIRYFTAAYITSLATPLFWFVRVAQLTLYPPLVWLINVPAYNAADWVSVSRQKFSGLVGHDLIWCLYCDWMTGVWSLGTEMLGNVESWGSSLRKLRRLRSDEWSAEWLLHSVHIGRGGLHGDAMVYRYEYQATIKRMTTGGAIEWV